MIPLEALADEARRILAKVSGSEEMEIYFRTGETWRFEQTQGVLENVEATSDYGVAVRCLQNGRVGMAYGRDARGTTLEALAEAARALARYSPEDPARRLWVSRESGAPGLGKLEPPAPPDAAEVQQLLSRMEQTALACDARVRKTHQSAWSRRYTRHWIINSRGLEGTWSQPEFALSLAALAESRGDSQLGEAYQTEREALALAPESVGQEAGAKAARMLGARVLPTQRRTVIFPPAVVTGFLEAAFPAWTAEAWQKHRSFLSGRAGQKVAESQVHILDEGQKPDGLFRAPMDEEGVPTQNTELVRGGMLCGSLHTAETAIRSGEAATGNSQHAGVSQPLSAGPTNFLLRPGTDSTEALMRRHPGAFYAADVLGLHTLDPVSGEFSLGAAGWLVSPESEAPVRGVTLSGNLLEWLKGIEGLADDAKTYGHFSAPTIAVSGLMVAGS